MAFIFCLNAASANASPLSGRLTTTSPPSPTREGFPILPLVLLVYACLVATAARNLQNRVEGGKGKRRDVLFGIALTTLSLPTAPDVASAADENAVSEDFRLYTDEENKFKMLIPQDWHVGSGEPKGFKSITAFYPPELSTSNVSVVISGLGADFTRMESFGKVEAFADTLVSGLDRSWRRPPGVAATLIDCKSSNGLYYIEYTLQNPGESRKHLYSAIGMASNGWYNRLYTVTGQFIDEESEKYSSKIEKAVGSFRFI